MKLRIRREVSLLRTATAVCLIIVFFAANLLLAGSAKVAIILSLATLFFTFICLELSSWRCSLAISVCELLVGSFAMLILSQLCLNESAFGLEPFPIWMGFLCCLAIVLVCSLISLNIHLSLAASIVITLALSTINHFVYQFRGNEFRPLDIFSAEIAASILDSYTLHATKPMVYAWCIGFVFIFMLTSIHMSSRPFFAKRWKVRIAYATAFLTICSVFLHSAPKVKIRNWDNAGMATNGFLLNFTLQAMASFVVQPDGYSLSALEDLEATYSNDSLVENSNANIIVIMNESFSDFSVYSDSFDARIPYYNSLQDDMIKGYTLSSIYGGSTCNSEFEFLTGNTMAFLPIGSIPYQNYIKEDTYSLVSVLKNRGYDCVAMHPYYADGWMRNTVYPHLGFEEMYFLEDYPQKNMVRDYVSDQEMYERLIARFEAKDEGTPLFIMGVTMQNHGGYEYDGENYTKTVTLDGFSSDTAWMEQYLSILRESDRALQYLIEYFEAVEEPTLILFFGDHQPTMSSALLQELYGSPLDTLDEQQLMYQIPFFLWANYDIGEQDIPLTSLNFLSNYVLEAANLELPAYNRFLLDLQQRVPAINALGYYSKSNGCFLPLQDAAGDEAEWLRKYMILQYNSLFEKDAQSNIFFPG